MLSFKQYIEEAKSPYSSDVEQDIVRFHADGIRNSIKTGENFSLEHVKEYVEDEHPDYPSNVQTLRKHIFAPAAHHRISSSIEENDPDFERVTLQRGAGKRATEAPKFSPKQIKYIKFARGEGHSWETIGKIFGVSGTHLNRHRKLFQ